MSGNHNPEFSTPYLEVEPPPINSSRSLIAPASASCTVALDGSITLTTFAKDPDGDPLTCKWTCNSAKGPGYFSAPGDHRMRWDPQKQHWVGRWSWKPPKDASPEEIYRLECIIEDGRGGALNTFPVSVEIPQVFVLRAGRLVYTTGREIWQCNWDGTDAIRLVRRNQIGALTPDFPKWSFDGTKFSFITLEDGGIWCANRDGRDLHRVRTTGNTFHGLSWHPSGHTVYMLEDNSTTNQLSLRSIDPALRDSPNQAPVAVNGPALSGGFKALSVDPSGHLFLTSNSSDRTVLFWRAPNGSEVRNNDWEEPTFTPDGQDVLFFRGGNRLVRQKVTVDSASRTLTLGSSQSSTINGLGQLSSPIQSPDGRWLLCQSTQAGDIRLVLMKSDGTNPKIVPLPTNRADSFDWCWY